MLINPYSSTLASGPWLFDDLKSHFRHCRMTDWPDVRAQDSSLPLARADAWIAIRACEAHLSPDPVRTIVQIHCNTPRLWGDLEIIRHCRALVYTNPAQVGLMRAAGVSIEKPALLRPLGALQCFTLREDLPELPSFGWIGRDTGANKRTDLFAEAMVNLNAKFDLRAVLVGARLRLLAERLFASGIMHVEHHDRATTTIDAYPEIYQSLDAIVITSESEAGPMPLFEALASGVPVVTTDCGWARWFIENGINGYIVEPYEIADRLLDIASHRSEWFGRRQLIRATLRGWTLEGWIEDNIRFAMEVCK